MEKNEKNHIKKKIMDEGFPLQRFCSKTLEKLGWNIDEEYPVEQENPIDWNPYVSPKYPRTSIRTSGDIRATFQNVPREFAICVCISCKRQLKIDWGFMKAMFTENVHRLFRSIKISNYVQDYVFDLKHGLDNDYSLCNIPTNLQNRSQKNGRNEDKISQTAENLYFETWQTFDDYIDWLNDYDALNEIIYIPVIVTGATIHTYDIDESKFDINTIDSIRLQEVKYLMYQHHLPKSMHRKLLNKTTQEESRLEKFNVFVVHYSFFEDFIKALMKKFEKHPL